MGIFSDVSPGERWRPEPAERYNRVNAVIGAIDAGGAGTAPRLPAQRGALIVQAAVASGASIAAYIPVALSGAVIAKNPGDPADAIFRIASKCSGGETLWGVTQAPTVSGGVLVPVLLQGLTAVSAAGAVTAGDTLAAASGGVVSGAGAARALTNAVSGGVCLAQLGAGAAAETPGYSSYFKITVDPPASGAAVVSVFDGGGDSRSYAVVNGGSTYALPPYTETVSGGALYLLKYTPAQYGSGGTVVSAATMVISSLHEAGGSFPALPDGGTSGAYYYQLGRVIWSGGSAPRVVQDHTAGVAQFQWFANCYLG